jgi:branched-chain amino acid transport system substrate-binding protein
VGSRLLSLIGPLSAIGLILGACTPAPAAAPTSAPAAAPTTAPAAAAPTATTAAAAKPAATTAPTATAAAAAKPAATAAPTTAPAAAAKPAATTAPAAGTSTKPTNLTADFTLDLRYGVLAGLTGDGAAFGQPWNQAANLAVDYINQSLKDVGLSEKWKLSMVDAQDTGGNAQQGVEAAKKLVTIDKASIVIGDFFSASTAAVAPAVTIPAKVLQFTGGTNPSLTKLNTAGQPTLLWQPVPADDLQGKVLAQLMGEAFGKDATVNVGIRNDAYGNGLGDVFKSAWTSNGGKIGQYVVYNPTQPTYDTEAQQLVEGNPAGWLFVDFCANWVKLVGPLQRTGKWDGAKSFGGDSLTDCGGGGQVKDAAVPGFRSTSANVKSGSSFQAFQDLYQSKVSGTTFNSGTSEAFDAVFVSFLAAVSEKSDDPVKISPGIVKVTNPPGKDLAFTDLPTVLQMLLAGQQVHFNGAGGALNFEPGGRVTSSAYDIWKVNDDGSATITQTIIFKG